MVGPWFPGHYKALRVQSQYSSMFSFFQAKTLADLAAAIAAAA